MPETGRESNMMGAVAGEATPAAVGTIAGIDAGPPGDLLGEEIAFYSEHLDEWERGEGKHVLIRGRAQYGFYETRDEALLEGLRRFGRVPFLVKRVARGERPRPLGVVIL